jgi:hypothetical protein
MVVITAANQKTKPWHCLLFLDHPVSLSYGSSMERSQDVEVSVTNVKNYVYVIANFTDHY